MKRIGKANRASFETVKFPDRDSNPNYMNQNHMCYHYTIGETVNNTILANNMGGDFA